MINDTEIWIPWLIQLSSEPCFFFSPPAQGEEVKQHLTLRRDGSGTLSRFVIEKAKPYKLMGRRRIKVPEETVASIIDDLAAAFNRGVEMLWATDVGTWCLTFEVKNGGKRRFSGCLVPDDGYFSQESAILRSQLGIPQLFAFDGLAQNDIV